MVYSILFGGWASFTKYAIVGAIRSCSQAISYEISLTLFIVAFLIFIKSFNLENFFSINYFFYFIF